MGLRMSNKPIWRGAAGAAVFAGLIALFAFAQPALHFGTPARAQLGAAQTWIPSGGVSGSGNAVVLTVPNIGGMSDLLGVPLRFLPQSTNAAGGTTIAISNGTSTFSAEPVLRSSAIWGLAEAGLAPIAGGDLTASPSPVRAEVMWDGTEFVLSNPATGDAPVGEIEAFVGSDTWGTTQIPGRLILDGSCVSQTTYALLYSYSGGSGDPWGSCSSGQFKLPDLRGRGLAGYDSQGSNGAANRLTSAGSGCAATGVGATCGGQNETLVQSNLPNVTFANSGIAVSNGGNTGIAVSNGGNTGIALTSTVGINAGTLAVGGSQSYLGAENNSGGYQVANSGSSGYYLDYVTPSINGSSFSITGSPALTGNVTISNQGNSQVSVSSQGNSQVSVSAQGSAASGGSGTPVTTVQPTATVVYAVKY
jgi:hypothetical protein